MSEYGLFVVGYFESKKPSTGPIGVQHHEYRDLALALQRPLLPKVKPELALATARRSATNGK
jgi:hypothetical protein